MLKKINDVLSGLPMTIVGAVFLVISFVLNLQGIRLLVDPAWVTVIICGIPLLYLALWRIVYNPGIKKISSALLISIAMVAAICIGDLFAAGEVAFIMALGAILEDMTTERAKKGLKEMIRLAPVTGRRIREGEEEIVDAQEIRKGDILRILPGETIPVDGIIVSGQTSVDQSIMTGESLPVDKGTGDEVFCGTINRFGSIDMEAVSVGADTSLQKLIRMVEEADQKQAPMQRLADQAASYLVPIALAIAIVAGIIQQDIIVTVTVMVVFCPCALVLATPTAIMAAIGQATKHGVLIKSGEALERMGKADRIAFDKTGTLTFGQLHVSDIHPFGTMKEDELLALAAGVEERSEHPLGKAITACARERQLQIPDSAEFQMFAGGGVCAHVGNRRICCGSERFLETVLEPDAKEAASGSLRDGNSVADEAGNRMTDEAGNRMTDEAGNRVADEAANRMADEAGNRMAGAAGNRGADEAGNHMADEAGNRKAGEAGNRGTDAAGISRADLLRPDLITLKDSLQKQGKAVIFVMDEEKVLGLLACSDVLRPDTAGIIKSLDDLGTQTVLLTGDHPQTADYFAKQAGIREVQAGLLPADKVRAIEDFKAQGNIVCMVGDGVNDAPALKTADIGVAMGGMGSDIAVEAADIALMGDDISKLPYLKRLANATVHTIRCSITISMCINFVAVTLSVLGVLGPTTGALVHNAGSCFVVLFAALLYDRKF